MKDEFTTKMHADMLGWSQEDAILIDAYTYIHKGLSKSEACILCGISEDYYDEKIEQAKIRGNYIPVDSK